MSEDKRYAYCSTDWIWDADDINTMKGLLLSFDGLAMSLPPDLFDSSVEQEPVLAGPLLRRGLLVNADPKVALDENTRKVLTAALYDSIDICASAPELGWEQKGAFHFGEIDTPAARRLVDKMVTEGMSSRPDRGGIVNMNWLLRSVVLHLYAEALHCASRATLSYQVFPVELADWSDDSTIHKALKIWGERLQPPGRSLPGSISAELVVPLDLELAILDDVLEFREHHTRELHAYMKSIEEHTAAIALSDRPDRIARERDEEIADYNASLRSKTRYLKTRSAVSVGISVASSVWSATTGNLGAAIFALLAAAAGIPRNETIREVTSYSYLAKVKRRFG